MWTKITTIAVFCVIGILLAGCTYNNANSADIENELLSRADTQSSYSTDLALFNELEALGVHATRVNFDEDGQAVSLYGFIELTASAPFGIRSEETLELLLDAMDTMRDQGIIVISVDSSLYEMLTLNGLWETFSLKRSERLQARLPDDEYTMLRRLDNYNEGFNKARTAELEIWPNMVDENYIKALNELGFDGSFLQIQQPISIRQIPEMPYRLYTEEDIEMLLSVLFYLSDARYFENWIVISEVAEALREANLWYHFIAAARSRFEENLVLLDELEALGVLIIHSFREPEGLEWQNLCFSYIWAPYQTHITINPDVDFAISSDAHFAMLAQAMQPFSGMSTNISEIQQELVDRGLWNCFSHVYQHVSMYFLEQALTDREERIRIYRGE